MATETGIGNPEGSLDFLAEDGKSGLNRHIGPVGLLFAGVGSIIGSGWLFGAFYASTRCWPAGHRRVGARGDHDPGRGRRQQGRDDPDSGDLFEVGALVVLTRPPPDRLQGRARPCRSTPPGW